MEINKAMKLLLETSKNYKSVSVRAARFFFVSNDLIKLNPMYQFTHEWFLGYFKQLLSRIVQSEHMNTKKEEQVRDL